MTLSKVQRIELRKKEIGTKHYRKLKRYSDSFNEMFYFFLKVYRSNLLDFCGSKVKFQFQKEGVDSKEFFRMFENGNYRNDEIYYSRQNRISEGVIIAKKSWGLHVDMWSDGIVEWCFSEEEIINTFREKNIQIPGPLLLDFYNTIERKKFIRNQKYLESLK